MKRHVLLYGLVGGLLIALLKWTEYRFVVVEHSVEIYGGLTAATFAVLGIWLGMKLTAKAKGQVELAKESGRAAPDTPPFAESAKDGPPGFEVPPGFVDGTPGFGEGFLPCAGRREALNITPREFEILGLIAEGLSNREIAERLFVSENTVKTHSSRVFDKLGAKRRTQAVQLGKEFGLLP